MVEAITDPVEMTGEARGSRCRKWKSIGGAGGPVSGATEGFGLFFGKARLPKKSECHQLMVGDVENFARWIVQKRAKLVFPVYHLTGAFLRTVTPDRILTPRVGGATPNRSPL